MVCAAPTTNNPASNSARIVNAASLLAGAALAASAVISRVTLPMPPCFFKLMFHLPCPGCGMTRSWIALWHGNLPLSFRYHPLGLPLFLCAFGVCLLALFRLTGLVRKSDGKPVSPVVIWYSTAAMLSVWVMRLALVYAGNTYFLW